MENKFSCEKAGVCGGASPQCYKNPETLHHIGWTGQAKEIVSIESADMICEPKRRWMYCWQYKHKLGMVFDKDLGIYILPEWKKTLMERAKK